MQAAAQQTQTHETLIGRQAIHDRENRLFGYELLYRDCGLGDRVNGDQASSRVLINSFMEIGLHKLVGDRHAFINLTGNFFSEFPDLPFDSGRIVLEVLEDISLTPAVIAGVRRLAERGIPIALDDFAFEARWDPLIPLASIIKVEIPAVDIDSLPARLEPLRALGLKLLAEKVETPGEYHRLRAMGFDLFQGYYFSRPEIIEGRRLSEHQHVILRLIATLNDPASTLDDLEQLIAGDAALSLKILRYINSAAVATTRKIESIRQATVLMGRERIRALASLIALSRIPGKAEELFNLATVRAHLCAAIAGRVAPTQQDAAYTVGLLSILDALMDQPMHEILADLSLDDALIDALQRHDGMLGRILQCALSLEDPAPTRHDGFTLSAEELHALWLESLEKAFALSRKFHEFA